MRVLARTAGLLAVLFLALELGVQVFLNTWLPILVSQQRERIELTLGVAWMVIPGEVRVRNLRVRQQAVKDQWLLAVDDATVSFDLGELWHHTIHITTADAHGASFRWRARLDAQVAALGPESQPPTGPGVVADLSPPITGFTNPPSPSPEAIYPPANPWRVELDDVHIDGIREVWIADYRYVGDATAHGALKVEAKKWVEVEGATVELHGGDVTRGAETMLRRVEGKVNLDLVGTDPATVEGRGLFGALSGTVAIKAAVANLSFLDFYLRAAPWLHLTGGVGELGIDINVQDGEFQAGSSIAADVSDIVARFLSYSVVGDGEVRLAVGVDEGTPMTTMLVNFRDFAITHDGDEAPHVKGKGFRVAASTPDVALHQPFTALQVVMDLPEAEIPDVKVYNAYLPRDLGLALRSGTGKVHGRLEISTQDNLCHGDLFLDAHAVHANLDDLTMSGDIVVHASVPRGDLDTGEYEITGTTLALHHVRLTSGTSLRAGKDDSNGWWAGIRVPTGAVTVGAPYFLDGALIMDFRDTVPFVTIFSEKQKLPGWIRGLLGVQPVTGTARVRLGDTVVQVREFQMFAGKFEVLLELERRRRMAGKLYARFGVLSLGLGMREGQTRFQLVDARKWYDEN